MKIDISILNKLESDGWVTKQSHPTLPLSIYKYSRECQIERHWTDMTRICRGLVIDNSTFEIVAKPFDKFFNIEELDNNEIPNESFEIFDKLDGSLGICFRYQNQIIIATPGSFESKQAIEAKKIFNELYDESQILDSMTYMFEILYPENQIVIPYTNRELVLLAINDVKNNIELSYNEIKNQAKKIGCRVIYRYENINNYLDIRERIDGDNKEGFVIKFESGFRLKMKYAEYFRIHSIINKISNITIWELLRNNADLKTFIADIPDEFDNWVNKTIKDLYQKYDNELKEIQKLYSSIVTNLDDNYTDKEFAFEVINNIPKEYRKFIFNIYRNIDISDMIWKRIRPEYEKAKTIYDE